MHHDSSSDFDALAADMVLRVLQHEGLTVDEETVRVYRNERYQRKLLAYTPPVR